MLASKLALGIILLINMDIDDMYIPMSDVFKDTGGVADVNYTRLFSVWDAQEIQLFASTTLGNAHSGGAGAFRSVFLAPSSGLECIDPACGGYKADLRRGLRSWSLSKVKLFNATYADFVTHYREQFYRIEVLLAPIHYSEPCNLYGCGNYRLMVSCARNNVDDDPNWLSTRTLTSCVVEFRIRTYL